MNQIFISHSHRDSVQAQRIANKLREYGQKVWIFSDSVEVGTNLPLCINRALKNSKVFVLLWSKNAVRSPWVRREWAVALMKRKKIITCRLDKTMLPDLLQVDLYIEFKNFRKGVSKLLTSLDLTTRKHYVKSPPQF